MQTFEIYIYMQNQNSTLSGSINAINDNITKFKIIIAIHHLFLTTFDSKTMPKNVL